MDLTDNLVLETEEDANSVSISNSLVSVKMRTRMFLLTGNKAFICYILSVLGSNVSTLQDLYDSIGTEGEDFLGKL